MRVYRWDRISPGDDYFVYGRKYEFPGEQSTNSGSYPILSHEYLQSERELLKEVSNCFEEANIDYWLSGGTLLGYERHGTTLPWDDDIDIHTMFDNRLKMYSSEFINITNKYNLEIIEFNGTSDDTSNRVQTGLRFRFIGTVCPVLDTFFCDEVDSEICKINSWKDEKKVYALNEINPVDDIFPLQTKEVDYGLALRFPANPKRILERQYGKQVMTDIRPVPLVSNHQALHHFGQYLFKPLRVQ